MPRSSSDCSVAAAHGTLRVPGTGPPLRSPILPLRKCVGCRMPWTPTQEVGVRLGPLALSSAVQILRVGSSACRCPCAWSLRRCQLQPWLRLRWLSIRPARDIIICKCSPERACILLFCAL